ncbi:MAG: hypothetical protein AB7P04_06400 [Bacteriovoracia bacterium]
MNTADFGMSWGRWFVTAALALVMAIYASSCSHEKQKNQAKEAAAKFWQDKAYPGKAYDVSVIEAEDAGDGKYRVKGIVDGETRVGVFNPETETFSEGYYSLAKERDKRIAELEQEVKYWKEKAEGLEKENYKFKVKLGMDADAKPKKKAEKAAEAPTTEE